MTPRPLSHLWLDALGIMQPVVGQCIERIYLQTELVEEAHKRPDLFKFTKLSSLGPNSPSLRVSVPPSLVTDCYHIEQVEALTYAACYAYKYHYGLGPWDTRRAATGAGCLPQNTASIEERWRLLMFERHYASLPVTVFEDRPRCPICHAHVGSGHKRKDAHDGCVTYGHTVLLPALRERKRLKEEREAAERASVAETVGEV